MRIYKRIRHNLQYPKEYYELLSKKLQYLQKLLFDFKIKKLFYVKI